MKLHHGTNAAFESVSSDEILKLKERLEMQPQINAEGQTSN